MATTSLAQMAIPQVRIYYSLKGGPPTAQAWAMDGSREIVYQLLADNVSQQRSDEVPVSSHRRVWGDSQQQHGYLMQGYTSHGWLNTTQSGMSWVQKGQGGCLGTGWEHKHFKPLIFHLNEVQGV
jgi:hypothetical protein